MPKTLSMSCDQAIFVDQATGASLFSDAVLAETDNGTAEIAGTPRDGRQWWDLSHHRDRGQRNRYRQSDIFLKVDQPPVITSAKSYTVGACGVPELGHGSWPNAT